MEGIGAVAAWLPRLGSDAHPASHGEKWRAGLGAFLGILAVVTIGSQVPGHAGSPLVLASMGASAVLLFAVPHSPMSRPWPLLGGHLLSATVGVSCGIAIDFLPLAAALAVALALVIMYYGRCLHPPGGATALAIVLGGTQVQPAGYLVLLIPVLMNVGVLLVMAQVFNTGFAWRGAQASATGGTAPLPESGRNEDGGEECRIAHSDLVYALSQMDTFLDVTEEDLLRIYRLATRQAAGGQS
ncbi:MAG: HPP family protein [Pseudomonadota bacterium]